MVISLRRRTDFAFTRLLMSNAVQKTMDAEVAGLDRAKSVLESRP